MIVVDTSALVALLAEDPAPQAVDERLAADSDLHAPHLLDVEFVHALRAMVRRGTLTSARAEAAFIGFDALTITRYPHVGLRERMWQLRENLTAYDASFVALSEALDVPLITADARLARADGHHAEIELL